MQPRALGTVILAFAQPALSAWLFAGGIPFERALGRGAGRPMLEPAGYAFAIWGVIYAGLIGYALLQALPSRRDNPLFGRIGPWVMGAIALDCAWLVAARLEMIWLSAAIIAAALACLAVPLREIERALPRFDRLQVVLVQWPIGLLAGWLTVAAFVNLAAALKASGWIAGDAERVATLVLLLAAGVLACTAAYRVRGEAAYASAVIWGLVGIVVADRRREFGSIVTLVAALAAFAVMAAAVRGRRRLVPPSRVRELSRTG